MDVDQLSGQIFLALFQLVALAIVVERGMFFAFDIAWWRDKLDSGAKAVITFAVSIAICFLYGFDVIGDITGNPAGSKVLGRVLTGFIIAGGSAGAMRLMQDFLKLSRSARDQAKLQQETQVATAKAARDTAEAKALAAMTKKRRAETAERAEDHL
jgi:hypothetical protein